MFDLGGPESFAPDEGGSSTSEGVSERAREQFAQAQQQAKQQAKDEKKAKKRDDRVAQTIKQFMNDEQFAHLFPIISRLAARDCPSIFILALLSLIHEEARLTVEEFIQERSIEIDDHVTLEGTSSGIPDEMRRNILQWISRLELVLSINAIHILSRLMIDAETIDGSLLQCTNFVLVDFFKSQDRAVTYEAMEPLTTSILQDLIEPHSSLVEEHFKKNDEGNDEED